MPQTEAEHQQEFLFIRNFPIAFVDIELHHIMLGNIEYIIINQRGGAKSGFLDKGVPVTQPPMDQMT